MHTQATIIERFKAAFTTIGVLCGLALVISLIGGPSSADGTPYSKCVKRITNLNTAEGTSHDPKEACKDKEGAPSGTDDTTPDEETEDETTDTTEAKAADETEDTTENPTTEDVVEKQDNETVPKGTLAVTRIVDNGGKTVVIFGGTLDEEFKVSKNGSPAMTAWVGYISEASARKAACTEGERSKTNSGFSGYDVKVTSPCTGGTSGGTSNDGPTITTTPTTVTTLPAPPANLGGSPRVGERLTGDCSGAPARTDSVIRGVDIGAEVPAGTLVEVRQVDHAGGAEWIEYGCLKADTVAQSGGLIAIDIWTGYSGLPKVAADACKQARSDLQNSLVPDSWNNDYYVGFLGEDKKFGEVPQTCPAR
ncbi:MAG TPA: hypothetical protein VNA13_03730 [Xanthomonadales bacterium]|nr:hypothetical protein [Xanthomonadales bacterium]